MLKINLATTTDGLLERIANAERADAIGSIELTWDKDTNEQYNALIGEIDMETADATLRSNRNQLAEMGISPQYATVKPMIDLPPVPDITSASALLGKFGSKIQKAQDLAERAVLSVAIPEWEDAQLDPVRRPVSAGRD